jgi:hypothetical protein
MHRVEVVAVRAVVVVLRQLPVRRLCQEFLRFLEAQLPRRLPDRLARDVADRVLPQDPAPEARLRWI